MRDIVYGARPPARNSGFAVIAVFTLAPGIGANTSIFSFVKAWVLRLVLYPNPSGCWRFQSATSKKVGTLRSQPQIRQLHTPARPGSAYRSYGGLAIRATQRGAGIRADVRARHSCLRVFSMEI